MAVYGVGRYLYIMRTYLEEPEGDLPTFWTIGGVELCRNSLARLHWVGPQRFTESTAFLYIPPICIFQYVLDWGGSIRRVPHG